VEELCDIIGKIIEEDGKAETNKIIMGYCNNAVGGKSYRNTFGRHGLGKRKQRGQVLIGVCKIRGHVIANTWF
jgi:hypothetical protein